MMQDTLRIGLAQMTSSDHWEQNIAALRRLAAAAAHEKCDMLALPEVSGLVTKVSADDWPSTYSEESDPFITAAQDCAAEHDIWIHLGSTPVPGGRKLRNRSALISGTGHILATYDKVHLFDFQLRGRKQFRESDRYSAGTEAVAVATPWGLWGMSICYDIRFPQLYRDYGKLGATVIFVPSAFTVPTGHAHWIPLLRARAIENGCWIVAAAQVGRHCDGRSTYGHSAIVSPWGRVVADLGGGGPGFAAATISLAEVAYARQQIASLTHERPFSMRIVEPS